MTIDLRDIEMFMGPPLLEYIEYDRCKECTLHDECKKHKGFRERYGLLPRDWSYCEHCLRRHKIGGECDPDSDGRLSCDCEECKKYQDECYSKGGV